MESNLLRSRPTRASSSSSPLSRSAPSVRSGLDLRPPRPRRTSPDSLRLAMCLCSRWLIQCSTVVSHPLIYFGGQFSHAIRKLPAVGDYRVQEHHGGSVVPHEPTSDEFAVAAATLAAAPAATAYARVDLVDVDGSPAVMELEAIEPQLFLDRDAGSSLAFRHAHRDPCSPNPAAGGTLSLACALLCCYMEQSCTLRSRQVCCYIAGRAKRPRARGVALYLRAQSINGPRAARVTGSRRRR